MAPAGIPDQWVPCCDTAGGSRPYLQLRLLLCQLFGFLLQLQRERKSDHWGHRGTPTPHPQGILCPSCVVAGRALPPPLAWVSRWVQGPSTRARPLFLRGITWELGRAARTAGGGVTPYTTTPAPYIFFSSAKNPSVVLAQLKPVFQAHLQDFHIHSLHNSAHVPEALTPCHARVSAPGHSCTVTRARMLPGTLGAPAAGMTAS